MCVKKPIGGYFELELPVGGSPYPQAFPVNNGRTGLELIIKARNYTHVYLPEYICPAVFEKLNQMDVKWTVYDINEKLEAPHILPTLRETDAFLYVNYFGIKDEYCRQLITKTKNLILDLTQAFFFEPPKATDAFNSVRKFVGVPDGGFVFGDFAAGLDLARATSWQYCEHLLRRLDGDVSGGYDAFKANDAVMCNWLPKQMSLLTKRMIWSIDFGDVKRKRTANFLYLHQILRTSNELIFEESDVAGPLCYPYLIRKGATLRNTLIENQIYVPVFWPNVEKYSISKDMQKRFQQDLVCLPIDQRYNMDDMKRITLCMSHLKKV